MMKNSLAQVFKRQQQILQHLNDKQTVQTRDLALELHVSELTIRRDLQDLEEQGFVRCIRGGANLISGSLQEDPSLSATASQRAASKAAIAIRAAAMVEDGDTIFINSSTTAIQMLPHIKGKRVIVITNNSHALDYPLDPRIELIFTGGEIYEHKKSMVGEVARHNLEHITASKAFLGVSGISARGITTSVLQETAINAMMIKRAHGRCIVLADNSKVGSQNNFMIGPTELVSTLITDSAADPGMIFQLREMGINVVTVETQNEIKRS